jgi:hypothetical protein
VPSASNPTIAIINRNFIFLSIYPEGTFCFFAIETTAGHFVQSSVYGRHLSREGAQERPICSTENTRVSVGNGKNNDFWLEALEDLVDF